MASPHNNSNTEDLKIYIYEKNHSIFKKIHMYVYVGLYGLFSSLTYPCIFSFLKRPLNKLSALHPLSSCMSDLVSLSGDYSELVREELSLV